MKALHYALYSLAICTTLNTSSASSIATQRSQYQSALIAFDTNKRAQADKLTRQLSDYALHPYLLERQLKRDISKVSPAKIERFRQDFQGTPIVRRVQASYLSYLHRNKRWAAYTQNYQKLQLTSATYRCKNLQALINLGKTTAIDQKISELWNVGSSQSKACDPVFSYWMKKGNPKSDLAFERSWKAINNKKYKIAKYVEKFVTKAAQKKSLATYWKVKKDIALITNKKTVSTNTLHNADIAAYAIRKLAIKEPSKAVNAWFRDRKRFDFSAEQRSYLNTYFGNKYAKKSTYDPKAPALLQRLDPEFRYDEVSEWKARLALIKQDWRKLIQIVNAMPQALREDTKWQYWLTTANHKLKPTSKKPNYQGILKERNFYSYAAAQLTRTPLQLVRNEQTPDKVTLDMVKSLPGVKRMAELVKIGDTTNAYREWRTMRDSLNSDQKIAVAHLTHQWGWFIQGIRIAAKLKEWDMLKVRFPRAQISLFEELGKLRGIGNTWPVAIARQESAYNQYARSPAGARGFMQLMPATAAATAKKYDIDYKTKADLYNPRINISLGTAYLSQMLERFGNKAYASAAYNAGPHRVKRWLKARGHLPLDIWIETIPFDETRHYVQNVLTYSAIYDLLAGRRAAMFTGTEKMRLAVNTK